MTYHIFDSPFWQILLDIQFYDISFSIEHKAAMKLSNTTMASVTNSSGRITITMWHLDVIIYTHWRRQSVKESMNNTKGYIHWSTNTLISLPDTVDMDFKNCWKKNSTIIRTIWSQIWAVSTVFVNWWSQNTILQILFNLGKQLICQLLDYYYSVSCLLLTFINCIECLPLK